MAQYATIWSPQETIFDAAWLRDADTFFLMTLVHYVPGWMTKEDLVRTLQHLGPGELQAGWIPDPIPGIEPCPYFADQTSAPFFVNRGEALVQVLKAGQHERVFPMTIPRRNTVAEAMRIDPIAVHPKSLANVPAEVIVAAIAAASAISSHGSVAPHPMGIGRTPKGRWAIPGVCGVRTDPMDISFNPISAIAPAPIVPISALQEPMACARCRVQKGRPVDAKNHFRFCVARHGNPLGRYWDSDETFEDEN